MVSQTQPSRPGNPQEGELPDPPRSFGPGERSAVQGRPDSRRSWLGRPATCLRCSPNHLKTAGIERVRARYPAMPGGERRPSGGEVERFRAGPPQTFGLRGTQVRLPRRRQLPAPEGRRTARSLASDSAPLRLASSSLRAPDPPPLRRYKGCSRGPNVKVIDPLPFRYFSAPPVIPRTKVSIMKLYAIATGMAMKSAPAMSEPQKKTSPRTRSVTTPRVTIFSSESETNVRA